MAVKKIRKWNPKYTKTSVKVALQNAFMEEHGLSNVSEDQNKFITFVLTQCDEVAKKKEDAALARLEAKQQK